MSRMSPSQAALNIIAKFEGLHRVSPNDGLVHAYRCPAGVWTIGYGRTKGVRSGMKITPDEAMEFLKEDLETYGNYVNQYVKVPLTQAQFDALTSFVFNLGPGNFARSTLLRKLNTGDYDGAAEQFARWNKARVDGTLQVLRGLTRRRTAEAALFSMDGPIGSDGAPMAQKPTEEAVKPLRKSKTMAGAGIAGVATIANEVSAQLEPLAAYSQMIQGIFLGMALLGIGLVAYSRWKEHKEGVH